MKNKFFLALLCTAIVLASCAPSKKAATGVSSGSTSGGTQIQNNHGYTSFRLSRTGCFGRCPAYDLTVYPDGHVQYIGRKNTPFTGVYEKNMSLGTTQQLYDTVSKYHLDTCQEQYPMRMADLPGLIYDFTYLGKKHVILNANFGPRFLNNIAGQMDALYQVDETWKKLSGAVDDK